ncbi:hypothetical protein [Parapedobacter koreensis]|uniref:Uncharacterized protein n=1 Tax=Parapedobacter koreensis TaxID=332977 RepID=A0A1H7PIH7_9SPHI|nr:hypothetical protein [Parapedobacter koreensis]SEL35416.1 hypothetical protein SAMN05421740_104386 [Parapedobacter koreensis]
MKGKFNRTMVLISVTLLAILVNSCAGLGRKELSIVVDPTVGAAVEHGLSKLEHALEDKNISFERVRTLEEAQGKWVIVAGLASGEGGAAQLIQTENRTAPSVPEALAIWETTWQDKPVWAVTGYDERGLMYGLLDVATRIGWANEESPMAEIEAIDEKPDVAMRAISMYTMNRAYWESRFYDEAYWERYLDMLSQNRFNSLVVIFGYENGGFLAPVYPYFFNVDGFPDVQMVGIKPEEQQRNLEALNRLISMAHDRGIDVSVGIWDHIYRGGVQAGGIPGQEDAPDKPVEGLVWGLDGDNLMPYTKAALARFIELVPDLDGIEFRMHGESGLEEGEQEAFWADVFKSMKTTAPQMNFVLRAKGMAESVIQTALDEKVNFKIETKYWMEQMGMPYHPTHINRENQFDRRHGYADMLRYPQTYQMYWRLWNGGTTRILLWGSPEYARRFTESTMLYNGDGFEVNEPLATKMEAQPHDARPFDLLNEKYRYYDYEFERYWHFFQAFGRMGYSASTPSVIWEKEFESRFGRDAGPIVQEAMHQASWILPRIITSVYNYESSFPTTRGWAEKQRLGDLRHYAAGEGSDIQQFASFDEEARLLVDGGETARIRPSANSKWFEQTSAELNQLIAAAEKAVGETQNKEFFATMTDLKILSNLALYHSRRIPAAVSYRIYVNTKDPSALDEAIAYEREAIEAWQQLVDVAGDVYTDNLMMGVRGVVTKKKNGDSWVQDLGGHWRDELVLLKEDLAGLEQERANHTKTTSTVAHYKPSPTTDVSFQIGHEAVTDIALGAPLTVEARISSPAGIKWVRLRHRNVNQELEYETTPMLPAGDGDTYRATVPPGKINPKWDYTYFIEVMDNEGHGQIYPDLTKETPYIIVKLKR